MAHAQQQSPFAAALYAATRHILALINIILFDKSVTASIFTLAQHVFVAPRRQLAHTCGARADDSWPTKSLLLPRRFVGHCQTLAPVINEVFMVIYGGAAAAVDWHAEHNTTQHWHMGAKWARALDEHVARAI